MAYTRTTLAAIATFALLPLSAAMAHPHHGLRAERLDGNGDGLISRAEATPDARLALQFALIDANSDGQLDRDELKAFAERARAAHDEARAARFVLADTDGNGRLEGDELADRRGLKRLDRNGDGAVDAEEWASPRGARHGLRAGHGQRTR